MATYLALLRGVNVGGKGLVPMARLREELTVAGLTDVRTYIQSGNIIFESPNTDKQALAEQISQTISREFGVSSTVATFTDDEWRAIVKVAPNWWGKGEGWKHNLLIIFKPYSAGDIIMAIGTLKPDIERVSAGDGVVYQSLSIKLFGRTTSGKLASSPIYKQMTIRNYNTAHRLLALLD